MDTVQANTYLARIDATRPLQPDAASLRELQRLHLLAVPFENLSIHLGEPVVLDTAALFNKIVTRRRGGFCYELNGAFAALLIALGYDVTLLGARVYGDGVLGPPLDHLALRVDLDEPWLVDVGFGRFSTYPLCLDVSGEQPDPEGVFHLTTLANGDIDIRRDGELQYRLEPQPRTLTDFAPTCWYHQTSPQSHFTHAPVCSLPAGNGRVTLSGRTLIQTDGAHRQEHTLAGDAEVLAAFHTHFGILLNRVPVARNAQ